MTDQNDRSDDSRGFTDDLRSRAIDAYDSARGNAATAGRRASDMIEDSPLVALGAGIAAGAIIAALIPTSRRERDLLRPYGDRVADAAKGAVDAGRKAGSDKLRELGLTPDVLADKASEAARATADAAVTRLKSDSD